MPQRRLNKGLVSHMRIGEGPPPRRSEDLRRVRAGGLRDSLAVESLSEGLRRALIASPFQRAQGVGGVTLLGHDQESIAQVQRSASPRHHVRYQG